MFFLSKDTNTRALRFIICNYGRRVMIIVIIACLERQNGSQSGVWYFNAGEYNNNTFSRFSICFLFCNINFLGHVWPGAPHARPGTTFVTNGRL